MRVLLSTLILFSFVPAIAAQDDRMAAALRVDHGAFDAILRATVRDERIDYVAVRDSHLPALQGYLDALAKVDVEVLPDVEKLPFWFNLYNASMVAAVVGRLRADWSPAADNYAIFKEKLVRVRGKTLSLDDVEHATLRKAFKEPRLHVALVCGARSCPPLLARAYRAEDLDVVLTANLGRFVNDSARNKIDHAGKKLQLSRLFDWFKDDFGGEAGVRKLIAEHTGRDVSRYSLGYLEYDWQLNLAAPAQGYLVRAKGAASLSSAPATDDVVAEVTAGELMCALAERDGVVEVVVPQAGDKRGFVAVSAVTKL